jgi:transposase InsO family protein
MPWKEVRPMDERMKFIGRLLDGERMTDLCREYGISRKTGYKFLNRYQVTGGVGDLSRRPRSNPHQTSGDIEKLILKFRTARPTWGPKKIKVKLEEINPGVKFPAASTIGGILERHGLVKPRRRKRFQQRLFPSDPITKTDAPNQVWCTDFKGQFRLQNHKYCFPLTVTDHFSRYLVGCEALENQKTGPTRECFEQIFEQYGVPEAILSDNGAPFGSIGFTGLSKLSVWWMSLGIQPRKIEPGCPEQNGRHERMHLTLKQQTTRPSGKNFLQQQERFDLFKTEYNEERPHEALAMKTPSDLYKPCRRSYAQACGPLEYPLHDEVRTVSAVGQINFSNRLVNISAAFAGQKVGLRALDKEVILVTFGKTDIGFIDLKLGTLLPDHPCQES